MNLPPTLTLILIWELQTNRKKIQLKRQNGISYQFKLQGQQYVKWWNFCMCKKQEWYLTVGKDFCRIFEARSVAFTFCCTLLLDWLHLALDSSFGFDEWDAYSIPSLYPKLALNLQCMDCMPTTVTISGTETYAFCAYISLHKSTNFIENGASSDCVQREQTGRGLKVPILRLKTLDFRYWTNIIKIEID